MKDGNKGAARVGSYICIAVAVVAVIVVGIVLAYSHKASNDVLYQQQIQEDRGESYVPQTATATQTEDNEVVRAQRIEEMKKSAYQELYDLQDSLDSLLSNRGNEVSPVDDDRTDVIKVQIESILTRGTFNQHEDMVDAFKSYSNIIDSYRGGYLDKGDFMEMSTAINSNIELFLETFAEKEIEEMYSSNSADTDRLSTILYVVVGAVVVLVVIVVAMVLSRRNKVDEE